MPRVLVTGMPGTGKSSALAELPVFEKPTLDSRIWSAAGLARVSPEAAVFDRIARENPGLVLRAVYFGDR